MSTNQNTPAAAVEPQEQPAAPVDAAVEVEPQDADQGGNREAAKYRRQLRETQSERDAVTSRLEAAQRQIIEAEAGKHIDKPASLWASGVQLADLLDDDGNVDIEKVTAASTTALEELGLTARRNGPIIPNQGQMPDRNAAMGDGWSKAFSPVE